MKRARMEGGGITGGTGDVNPQFMQVSAAQSAGDTTTTTTLALPIQRLPTGGRAQVVEVLRVGYFPRSTLPASASATEVLDSISVAVSTSSFGTTSANFSEPRVISYWQIAQRSAFTAAGTYMAAYPPVPFWHDLTDGAGHGLLVATDNLYIQVSSSGTGQTNTVDVKLLYRWKNVGLQEYVGLVQSQQ